MNLVKYRINNARDISKFIFLICVNVSLKAVASGTSCCKETWFCECLPAGNLLLDPKSLNNQRAFEL